MNLFNPGAYFIIFREVIEAVIVLCVLLRFVDRLTHDTLAQQSLKRQIWIGVFVALFLSLASGISLTVVFYILGKDVFGDAEPLWEGLLQVLACVMLTWLAFKMLNMNRLITKWEEKISKSSSEATLNVPKDPLDSQKSGFKATYAFGLLSFTIVLREGLEAVLFIAGVGSNEPLSLVIPSIVGLLLGLLVGWLLYKGSSNINLHWFFVVSSVFIFLIAAGMTAGFAHEFEEYYYEKIADPNAEEIVESTTILWDISACCSQKTNGFFQILNGLVGWRSVGTVATVTCYFTYWAVVLIIFSARHILKDCEKDLDKKLVQEAVVENESA